jgi:3-oxoacyl-[acyl-carrier protein] reductase
MGRLDGHTALITGAASGFGKGITEAFVREGAAVMITDIDRGSAEALARQLKDGGATVSSARVDITDGSSLDHAVAQCEAELGGLSILVANAGIGQQPAAFLDTSADLLHTHYDVNAAGAVRTCHAGLPALRRHGAGASILITVSGIALVPRPALYA